MKVLDKIKTWLEDEIEANEKYGDDYTDTVSDLLGLIKIWEIEEEQD